MRIMGENIDFKELLDKLTEQLYIHKYGLMGTLAFHLILGIFFISFKLQNVEPIPEANILIEFPEEILETPEEKEEEKEEKKEEKLTPQEREESIDKLLKSIAVNKDLAENKRKQATQEVDDYIKELQKELDQQNANLYKNKNEESFKKDSIQHNKDEARRKIDSLQTVFYSGPSSVEYKLKDRYKTYLPIPVFKCENDGQVTVQITVNRYGRVTKAEVIANLSKTKDELLWKTAIDAAKRSRFNENPYAPVLQKGTISYNFIRQ